VTLTSVDRAQSRPARIVTGLRATFESLGWIAEEAGIFRRLGLKVVFPRLETGGPEAVAGVVRGDWDFAETGSAPYVQSMLEHRDVVILLAALEPLPTGLPILTRSQISDARELDGARIGVLTDTGQVALSVRTTLDAWGVTATLVPLGTFRSIYTALTAGTIDAGALSADYRFLGPREHGFRVLETPSAGIVPVVVGCTRRLVATDRRLVALVVRGYVEVIHFFKTRRAEVIPLLQRFLQFEDRGAVAAAYDFYAPLLQVLPRPHAEGLQTLLRHSVRSPGHATTLSWAEIVDASFLDELDRTGLVRQLYR
jgi:ABC-type nitrate/sulfonate/bicarbonate transport system substrate-binding protein